MELSLPYLQSLSENQSGQEAELGHVQLSLANADSHSPHKKGMRAQCENAARPVEGHDLGGPDPPPCNSGIIRI